MSGRRAVVSGHGIAGASIAHWLVRDGWEVTVVERAGAVRSSGNPVDVRGEAVAATRAMGCYDELRAHATGATDVAFVDRAGRRFGGMAMEPSDGAGGFEIARLDLARGLAAAAAGAQLVWGDSIAEVHQDEDGVDVRLDGGARLRADILIAADGLHSAVRGLVLAPEEVVVTPMGMWIATLRCPVPDADPSTVRVYNEPGRSAALHPGGGHPGAALMFRDPAPEGADLSSVAAQKRFVLDAYASTGWLVPDILEHVAHVEDLYFDAVSRVRVSRWWRGRTVLLGDAASSVTIFGDGSSMAIVGAMGLARALRRHPTVADAFQAYERAQRARVAPHQRRAQLGAHFLVPSSRLGLGARNALLRALPSGRRTRRAAAD